MSLSSRAIALQGIGFAAAIMAVQGFAPAEVSAEVVEHRPHRNLHLRPIVNGHGYVKGVAAESGVGVLTFKRPLPTYIIPSLVVSPGPTLYPVEVVVPEPLKPEKKPVSIAARATFTGATAETFVATLSPWAGGGGRIAPVASRVSVGEVLPRGGACASVYGDEVESFVGDISGRGIQNPTDEQLALIAALLTRRRV